VTSKLAHRTFDIGMVYVTERCLNRVNELLLATSLSNHKQCKWLNSSSQDEQDNKTALRRGQGIVKSTYRDDERVVFIIMTNLFLSITIVLHRDDI
jgi:hypothetical protein